MLGGDWRFEVVEYSWLGLKMLFLGRCGGGIGVTTSSR